MYGEAVVPVSLPDRGSMHVPSTALVGPSLSCFHFHFFSNISTYQFSRRLIGGSHQPSIPRWWTVDRVP